MMGTKLLARFLLLSWIALANRPLPVPLSPKISTVERVWEIFEAISMVWRMASELPTMLENAASFSRFSLMCRCSCLTIVRSLKITAQPSIRPSPSIWG